MFGLTGLLRTSLRIKREVKNAAPRKYSEPGVFEPAGDSGLSVPFSESQVLRVGLSQTQTVYIIRYLPRLRSDPGCSTGEKDGT